MIVMKYNIIDYHIKEIVDFGHGISDLCWMADWLLNVSSWTKQSTMAKTTFTRRITDWCDVNACAGIFFVSFVKICVWERRLEQEKKETYSRRTRAHRHDTLKKAVTALNGNRRRKNAITFADTHTSCKRQTRRKWNRKCKVTERSMR